MNVKQIYEKYQIPPNLQKHMLRVAALSQIVVENWQEGSLDKKESITPACLFHDMANIIKFDFSKPQLFKDEEKKASYWKKIQKEIIEKYGTNIHQATHKICKEIGLSDKILDLVENLEWDNALKILKEEDLASAITIYCDMRIGPFGILSLKERIKNLQTRNKSHDFAFIIKAADLLEKTLQKYLLIDVNSINDFQIKKRFKNLLKLEIK